MALPLNAQELAEKYPAPEFRAALRRLRRIHVFLEKTIIPKSYRVSTELHTPIKLTPYGERVFQALTRKQVPYPEARLLCFLEMWHTELLVDPLETDADALTSAISKEIEQKKIRFPFTHGRLLYDRLADRERPDRNYLPEAETWALLQDTPQGIAQIGTMVAGPYGILKSKEVRTLQPDRRVAYHCSDLSCNDLHRYYLLTSTEAEINENRSKISKEMERESKEASKWAEFLANTNKDADSLIYDDMNGDPLPFLIGDTLDLDEQKLLLGWLFDNTAGELRETVRGLGMQGKAQSMCGLLGSAEVIQLICLASNKQIIAGLDTLVLKGTIKIPENETRAPVLNAFAIGPYGLCGELNRYGVRLRARSLNAAPLRLRRLVGQMYPLDSEPDRQELDWQLREETAERLEAKIDQYLRRQTPREAVSTLLLARRSNVVVATEKLQIQQDLLTTDEDRINSTLWKLGYSISDSLDPHAQFWRYHEAIDQTCRQSMLNPPSADMEEIRERSVNYFVALEEILRDSLTYTTWALTSDHYASDRRLVFRPHIHATAALEGLRSFLSQHESDHPIDLTEPVNLYALTRGFRVLADHLSHLSSEEDIHRRPEGDLPGWAKVRQGLQVFPFLHTHLFLDLAPESREKILSDLKEISRALVAAEVSDVRNSLLHPRPADLNRLRGALDSIEGAVRLIQRSGYSRQVFRRIKREVDESGRATSLLANTYGETAFLHSPSHFEWAEFPATKRGLHFMTAAFMSDPPETLRFETNSPSAYSKLWENYPRRPQKVEASSGLAYSVTR
ncbi:hypothetical protein [Micromonospora sp. NPDC085948]|uniref:hypothetical protein n=1 Tax=Micromonospora sp. NPDC085948 TaxID=3155293 RepID=UPI00341CDA10